MNITKFILIVFFLALARFLCCQNEISLNFGYAYNDYKIVKNPGGIFRETSLSKLQPSANLTYSFLNSGRLHSFQIGVINFNRSYYLEDSKFGYEHSNSYTYWKLGYTVGKQWFFDSKHKFSLSSSLGCNIIIKQRNVGFDNIGNEIVYQIDSNLVHVMKENIPNSNPDIGLVNLTYFKLKLFNKIGLKVGVELFIWSRATFADSKYSILFNSDYIGELNIKSYKPNVYGFLGFSYQL